MSKRAVKYGPEPHPIGPMRFEHQPAKVRRRGRKGMALMSRSQRMRQKGRWAHHRGDAAESRSFYDAARSIEGGSRRRRRRSSSRSSSREMTRRERRYERRMSRSSSRGSSRRTMSRRGSRPMSMAGVRAALAKHKSWKAWICVGPARTGCGGGKKGRRGGRVLGYLR